MRPFPACPPASSSTSTRGSRSSSAWRRRRRNSPPSSARTTSPTTCSPRPVRRPPRGSRRWATFHGARSPTGCSTGAPRRCTPSGWRTGPPPTRSRTDRSSPSSTTASITTRACPAGAARGWSAGGRASCGGRAARGRPTASSRAFAPVAARAASRSSPPPVPRRSPSPRLPPAPSPIPIPTPPPMRPAPGTASSGARRRTTPSPGDPPSPPPGFFRGMSSNSSSPSRCWAPSRWSGSIPPGRCRFNSSGWPASTSDPASPAVSSGATRPRARWCGSASITRRCRTRMSRGSSRSCTGRGTPLWMSSPKSFRSRPPRPSSAGTASGRRWPPWPCSAARPRRPGCCCGAGRMTGTPRRGDSSTTIAPWPPPPICTAP